MDVTRIGTAIGVYKAFAPKTTEKSAKSEGTKDIFTLSEAAKDFQTIKKALGGTSDVRQEKVDALKAKINDNTYTTNSAALAEKFISKGFLF